MVRETNGSQAAQLTAMHSTADPARQSRRVSHQMRQTAIAGTDTHQMPGFPIASTSRTYGPAIWVFVWTCRPAGSVYSCQ